MLTDFTRMKILIDAGHGVNTPGKRSPDGRLREYAWAREIAKRLESALKMQGLDAERIVHEETDISIRERVRRVNTVCKAIGASNVLLVSIHINAAGNYGWNSARGWSVWVAPNASSKSKNLARCLYEEADRAGYKGNRSVPASKFWVGNFGIIRDTMCPAVLTENLFQDNKEDVEILLSEQGKQDMVDIHLKGIKEYLKKV